MNVAVILAGGSGNRFGTPEPKQFAIIEGKSVLERSVETIASIDGIDEICVVSHPDWIDRVTALIKPDNPNVRVIAGGSERYMSSLNAIMAYIDYADDTNLIFHDAARPCVARKTVESVLKALEKFEAVAVGVPATDTLWEVTMTIEGMEQSPEQPYSLLRVPERKRYWMAQTPQAFRLPLVRDAYQRALQDSMFRATDDCGVVARYMPEVKIHLVQGDADNIKITHPHDLDTAAAIIRRQVARDGGIAK